MLDWFNLLGVERKRSSEDEPDKRNRMTQEQIQAQVSKAAEYLPKGEKRVLSEKECNRRKKMTMEQRIKAQVNDVRTNRNAMWDNIASPQAQLWTLLEYATIVIEHSMQDGQTSVFRLIKLLTERMVLDNAFHLLTEGKGCYLQFPTACMMDINPDIDRRYGLKEKIKNAFDEPAIHRDIEISLACDPVIVFPWDEVRQVTQIVKTGADSVKWQQFPNNHRFRLVLPVGVSMVTAGLHSTLTGILKGDGVLTINAAESVDPALLSNKIVDISSLFGLLKFDGRNYILQETGEIAGKAVSFEFGCIFEIGRILHERNICFKNLNEGSDF